MTHARLTGIPLLAAAMLAACGAQIGLGGRGSRDAAVRPVAEVQGRLHSPRHDGPYASVGGSFAEPKGTPAWQLRHVNFGTGWRVRLCDSLRLEFGGTMAFGEPAGVVYEDTGIYFGADSALLLRLPWFGGHDNHVGAAPIGFAIDAVVTGQGGYWSRVTSADPSQVEYGVGFAFRATFFSDLLVASDDSWEAAE